MKFSKFTKYKFLICFIVLVAHCLCLSNKISKSPQEKENSTTKFLDIQNVKNSTRTTSLQYSELFKYFGDKTFICISLLYFQSSPLMLFTSSSIVKILISYYKIFVNFDIIDIIPAEVFQIVGISSYFLVSFTILYYLMFDDEDKLFFDEGFKTKNKHDDSETINILDNISRISMRHVRVCVKVMGLVLISQTIHQQLNFNFSNKENELKLEKITQIENNKLIQFGIEALASELSVVASILLGFVMSRQLNIKCNLMISSITFLILGFDMAIKSFNFDLNDLRHT